MKRLWGLLAVFGLVVMFSASADAANGRYTQSDWTGEPVCGGVNLQTGKKTPLCGFAKATYQSKAKQSCSGGAFFDRSTWSCYSCPAGYSRTGNHVTDAASCSKAVPQQFRRATYDSKFNNCPAGSFFDLRNGGECWRCPAGYNRTAAAVDKWNACGKAFAKERSAELVATVCPLGTFGDSRNGGECWACPAGFLRTSLPVNGARACYRTEILVAAERSDSSPCKEGEQFDGINGGTCWRCPAGATRSVFHVNGPKACELRNIEWKSAVREEKSLFHIPGGRAVTQAVISQRTLIEKTSNYYAKTEKLDPAKTLAREWERIQKNPHLSPVLIGSVYAYVMDLIKKGPKTKDERDLLAYFAKYIQDTRRMHAIQIRDVYASWKGLNLDRLAQSGASGAFYIGFKPPELDKIATAVMGLTGGSMMISGFAMAGMGGVSYAAFQGTALQPFFQSIMPYAFTTLTTKMGEPVPFVITESLKTAFSSAGAVAGTTGPVLILTGAIIVAVMGIDVFSQNVQKEAKIEDALLISKQPVNLKRLLLSEVGMGELLSNWSVMTQGTKAPQIPFTNVNPNFMPQGPITVQGVNITPSQVNAANTIVPVVDQSIQAVDLSGSADSRGPVKSSNWQKVNGAAHDVAIGSDGTVYIIGTRQNPRGFVVLRRPKGTKSSWSPLNSPGAVRVAANGDKAWVVNNLGQVFEQQGPGFQARQTPTKAVDIGASAKGVWMAGQNKVVYQFDNGRWLPVTGVKAVRVEVDWDGRPLVINDKGEVLVHVGGTNWKKIGGAPTATDLAVDMPGGIRIVGTDGNIYAYTSQSKKWTPIAQSGNFAGIGVGGGQIWAVDKGARIYRHK